MLANAGPGTNEAAEAIISGAKVFTNGHKMPVPAAKSELIIRLARVGEGAQIAQLTSVSFRGREHFFRASFASAKDVEQLMTQGKFLLAENEKEIIGCAYLEPRIEATRLELLAVAPTEQRAGIGSQLLDAAERLSSSMQCSFVHVRVVNFHYETIAFCRRRGYFEFGIESLNRNEPVSLHCHIVRMCKRLEADGLAF
jgi:N-acetylglutamate synthase-like GNAT family acetyltransferase